VRTMEGRNMKTVILAVVFCCEMGSTSLWGHVGVKNTNFIRASLACV